jgi:hypothetical protein
MESGGCSQPVREIDIDFETYLCSVQRSVSTALETSLGLDARRTWSVWMLLTRSTGEASVPNPVVGPCLWLLAYSRSEVGLLVEPRCSTTCFVNTTQLEYSQTRQEGWLLAISTLEENAAVIQSLVGTLYQTNIEH